MRDVIAFFDRLLHIAPPNWWQPNFVVRFGPQKMGRGPASGTTTLVGVAAGADPNDPELFRCFGELDEPGPLLELFFGGVAAVWCRTAKASLRVCAGMLAGSGA